VSDITDDFHDEDPIDDDDDIDPDINTELDLEAPEADVIEQHIDLLRHRDVPITERPIEADPADAADQQRVVKLDEEEDDYR
jgi:hypothetical protein